MPGGQRRGFGVGDGEGVGVGDAERVGVGEAVGVALGDGVGVGEAVGVATTACDACVGLAVGAGVGCTARRVGPGVGVACMAAAGVGVARGTRPTDCKGPLKSPEAAWTKATLSSATTTIVTIRVPVVRIAPRQIWCHKAGSPCSLDRTRRSAIAAS